MPSFDVVSEVDMHEVTNAVDQACREVDTRFDFKNANAKIELKDAVITLSAETDFHIQQMKQILYQKLAKRGIDLGALKSDNTRTVGRSATQNVTLVQGVESELAKKIVRLIKDSKMKVQAAIQGDKVRITGKKRDDLQECIAMLRAADLEQPLQFNNFRD
jgi:uncharacterized protein YajQ (UPF0234 family)